MDSANGIPDIETDLAVDTTGRTLYEKLRLILSFGIASFSLGQLASQLIAG